MEKIRVALVKPPLLGHNFRGIGVYTEQLYQSINQNKYFNLKLVEFKDNLEDFGLIHYPYFDPFFLTLHMHIRKPFIITIHDLIPIKYPKYFPKGIRGSIKWQIQKLLAKKAAIIISDSASSANDIKKFIGIGQDKIKIIYLGIGNKYKVIKENDKLAEMKKKLNLPDKFILHVGDVNYNKNIPGILNAFHKAREIYPDLYLVLIGQGFVNPSPDLEKIISLINALNIEKFIIRLSSISMDELAGVYNLATIYIGPSFAEGFGLPPLEAMACGTPVVASDRDSLAEVLGNSAYIVDPSNYNNIADGLIKLLENRRLRESYIKKGLFRTKIFSWQKTAQKTVEAYIEIYRKIK